MAYNPTNWVNGDVVTSAKLNKIELALGQLGSNLYSANMVFHVTKTSTYTEESGEVITYDSDKTWDEVNAVLEQNGIVAMIYKEIFIEEGERFENDPEILIATSYSDGEYPIEFTSKSISVTDNVFRMSNFVPKISGNVKIVRFYADNAVVTDEQASGQGASSPVVTVEVQESTASYQIDQQARILWQWFGEGCTIRLQFDYGRRYGTIVGFSFENGSGGSRVNFVFTAIVPSLGLINFTAATESGSPIYSKNS